MIPEEHKGQILNSGIDFIRDITEAYGADKGMELWEQIASVLDPDVKGEIFFAMLTGHQAGKIAIRGYAPGSDFIRVIKAIRTVGGMDLKDAKDTANQLRDGQTVWIDVKTVGSMSTNRQILHAAGCFV